MSTLWYKTLALLLCTGCTIQPLYETKTESQVQTNGSNIFVEVISGKNGQVLRGYLQDLIRDLNVTDKPYTLSVSLDEKYVPYALTNEGYAQRLKINLTATVKLKDSNQKELVTLTVYESSSRNMSNSQEDILLLMYDKANALALKKLAFRIIENLKVVLKK